MEGFGSSQTNKPAHCANNCVTDARELLAFGVFVFACFDFVLVSSSLSRFHRFLHNSLDSASAGLAQENSVLDIAAGQGTCFAVSLCLPCGRLCAMVAATATVWRGGDYL